MALVFGGLRSEAAVGERQLHTLSFGVSAPRAPSWRDHEAKSKEKYVMRTRARVAFTVSRVRQFLPLLLFRVS
jgi:hypothetical protein